MTRKEELLKIFENVDESKKTLVVKLVDDFIFLEDQLEELRKLPHIKIHPKNPELQKPTGAGKLYKEYLQQYNNIIRAFASLISKDETDSDDSPLREYFKRMEK